MKQRTEVPLSRSEKFFRRMPVVALGAAALWAGGSFISNAVAENQQASDLKAERSASEIYVATFEAAALTEADPANIIGDPMVDTGESARIYDQAIAQLEALRADDANEDIRLDSSYNVNVSTLDITSKAISRANLIQPDSIFVIAKGDFDHNGKIDVAVQLAPEGYTIDTLSE